MYSNIFFSCSQECKKFGKRIMLIKLYNNKLTSQMTNNNFQLF